MKNTFNIFLVLAVLIGLVVASGMIYVVDETKQVVVTRFGKLIGEPITDAGLYFKMPFIDRAYFFDKRLLEWDGDANQIPTKEKRFIWVDTTARWLIKDPLEFFKTVASEAGAQTRLDDIIDASTRDIISSHALIEAIRNTNRINKLDDISEQAMFEESGQVVFETISKGREQLSEMILNRAAPSISDYGIELVDVKIKRINYVNEVQQKVYERMISERKRAAERFRSEGQGKRAEIQGQMVKKLEQITSEAYKQAQEVKGKADAKAIKVYANAFNKDPEFYAFLQTLETYKKTMDKDTTLILSTDNEFFNQLNGSSYKKFAQ